MKYKIKRNKHRAWPPTIGLFINKKRISKFVTFHDSCKYENPSEDVWDVNKLFGIGYFWHHHKDSARFGWVYDNLNRNIILMAYCYVNGERVIKELIHVPLEVEIHCQLSIENGNYVFKISTPLVVYTERIPFKHNKSFAYPLGIYFGGNQTPNHDMYITLDNG